MRKERTCIGLRHEEQHDAVGLVDQVRDLDVLVLLVLENQRGERIAEFNGGERRRRRCLGFIALCSSILILLGSSLLQKHTRAREVRTLVGTPPQHCEVRNAEAC